ncbi:MAG: amino acid permease [Acidobacteriota bacterium]|nr:MAG: amino acid permease [Acidobacteriota bacterium]
MAACVKSPSRGEFPRALGVLDSTALVVGTIVGSGIFLTTGLIARHLPSSGWILAVWLLGGVLSAMGALTFAQLGALRPEAGGAYVYTREAFGPLPAFLYGWTLFWILQCGSIAAIASGFSHYFGKFFPSFSMERVLVTLAFDGWTWHLAAGQLSAAAAVAVLTLLNICGLRAGSFLQNALAALKLSALAVFAAAGVAFSDVAAPAAMPPSQPASASAVGVALVAVLWAYAGWFNLNFAAEEIKNPRRTIPAALGAGLALVTALYLAVNWVYVRAVPMEVIRGVVPVAERVAVHLWGDFAASLVAAAVVVSTLGALNGLILMSPRAFFAMARDGFFFKMRARLHPRFRTPHTFLAVQGAWSCVLVLAGGYEALFTYVMFAGFLFTALACASLFVLRKRAAGARLPFRWTYPWVPAGYILVCVVLALNTLRERPLESLGGFALLALGAVWYRIGGK